MSDDEHAISTQSAHRLRKNMRSILDKLAKTGNPVVIERYGAPVAVMIGYEEYLSIAPLLHREPALAQ